MGLVKLIYITLFGLLSMLQMFALCYSLISQPPYLNANPFPMNSLTEAKLDLVIASVVLTGCWYGQKNLLKKSVRKLVLTMENFTVDGKENSVLIYKLFVMHDIDLPIYLCNIQLQHQIT